MTATPAADRLPFTRAADVAANREARFSGRQMLGLWYSGLWHIVVGLPTTGIGIAIVWTPDFLAKLIGLGLVGAGLYLSWRGFSFLGDAITRNVTYVTGRLHTSTRTAKSSTYYYMSVGPVTRRISRKTYEHVPGGLNCHAYYASGSLHLLSLEPATEAEPHPSLRFGGDAAHAWDRLRWRLVVAAVAALGVVAGVHTVTVAHPAQTFLQSGSISDYQERTGKGSYRHLYLEGVPGYYSLDHLNSYSPQIPDLSTHIGDKVDLYIHDGTDEVLALRLRETLYATDYYLHPEHQLADMINAGATITVLSGITLVVALWWHFLVRMKREVAP